MTIGRRIAKNLARVKMNVATKMHAIDFESLFSATQSHSIGAMHHKWIFKSVNFLSKSLICQKNETRNHSNSMREHRIQFVPLK